MRSSRWFPLAMLLLAPALLGAPCGGDTVSSNPCTNPDSDGDGADSMACGGTDCDDNDGRRRPSATEVCDGADRDEDCNALTFGDRDADGDGFVDALCCNVSNDGVTRCGDDCDDYRSSINPNASEVCNGFDDNCDTAIDEGVLMNLYTDADRDGYGAGAPIQGCFLYDGFSFLGNDCDDGNAGIKPGGMRCFNATQYQICNANTGLWTKEANCVTSCGAQPNGTGICL
jgi:hypothetical protein